MSQSHDLRPVFDIVKAKAKMKAAGKSYADLAKPLGYERQAVGHWFRGRGEPSVQQMKVMAREMGCHWLELVTEETTVLYRRDEIERNQRLRALSESDLAEIDAYLKLKATANS